MEEEKEGWKEVSEKGERGSGKRGKGEGWLEEEEEKREEKE